MLRWTLAHPGGVLAAVVLWQIRVGPVDRRLWIALTIVIPLIYIAGTLQAMRHFLAQQNPVDRDSSDE